MNEDSTVSLVATTLLKVGLFGISIAICRNKLRQVESKAIQSVASGYEINSAKATKSPKIIAKTFEHERKMVERLASASGGEGDLIERNKVVVRVPATSANLGPGFDAVGMAIDMWSEFTVERSDVFEITAEGE